MKRRTLLKGAIAGGIAASSLGRMAMAGMTPALTAVSATTLGGAETQLSLAAVTGLQKQFAGTLLQAQSPSYDPARALWNASFDKRPALIAQCTSTQDVVAAVRFGREHNLLTSVRCGGHSFSGKSVAENGLMIDLSFMHDVTVDTGSKTASAGGGARLGHLDMAALQHNLITTVGTDSDTGAGGLTLGGGMGRLNRKFGLTIDNLLGAEIVTANGDIKQLSATQNPDLFWAIRGGGGNFGVVTRFDYQLHDFNPIIYGGTTVFPWDKRRELLAFINEFSATMPDAMHLAPVLFNHPQAGSLIGIEAVYAGDHAEGETLLAPLTNFAKPVMGGFGPTPYLDMQLTANPDARESHYLKSGFVKALNSEVIEAVVEEFPQQAGVAIFFAQLGGAVARVDELSTPFPNRSAQFLIGVTSSWTDPAEFGEYRAAVRDHWARLEPLSMGFYTNLMDSGTAATMSNFGANASRLQAIKRSWDPDNFFRLNTNIPPAA